MFDKGFFNGYAEGSITTGEYGMPSSAITEELHLIVQTASFYPISNATKGELVTAIQQAAVVLGAKRNFIVGSIGVATKADK